MATTHGIITERVTFPSGGETLVGTLHRPAHASGPLPGVLATGSWTTVKEQMPGLYARKLAERGIAALAFDFRGWGESGGEPRAFESPRLKIEDIHAAAAYLRSIPVIDPARTGAVAICASAGYVAQAVAGGAPLGSLALIASWLHDPETVKGFYGGDEGVARRTAAGRAAADRYRAEGAVDYVPAYDPDDPDAGMFFVLDYYANPDRGRVNAWDNRLAVMSWPEWLGFDALSAAPRVRVPTLMVHADGAALPDNARRFFDTLAGPKDLFWTEGTQTDFYDLPEYVDPAVDLAVTHFARTLGFTPRSGDTSTQLAARADVVDRIVQFLLDVDDRNWTALREALTTEVHTDYTSLFGGAAQVQSAEALLDAWKALLPGFDATQHMLGPIVLDFADARATAVCAVTATHRLADDYWTVGGEYRFDLARDSGSWRIGGITLRTRFVQGDRELPSRATARARDSASALPP